MNLQLGEWLLSLRATDSETLERLVDALGDHRHEGDETPGHFRPFTYSLRVGGEQAHGRVRDLDILYFGTTPVLRTRSRSRAVRSLLRHLSTCLMPREGLLRVDGMAWIVEGRAVVTPRTGCDTAMVSERRLESEGLQLVDGPWLLVDSRASELVVPEPVLLTDSLEALPEIEEAGAGEAAAGRYPIDAWVTPASTGAQRIMDAAAAVLAADRSGEVLVALTEHLGRVEDNDPHLVSRLGLAGA